MERYDGGIRRAHDLRARREAIEIQLYSFIVMVVEASIGTGAYSHDHPIIVVLVRSDNA
jgi:hypothetical protein